MYMHIKTNFLTIIGIILQKRPPGTWINNINDKNKKPVGFDPPGDLMPYPKW